MKNTIAKTVIRTLIYQYLGLFVGISVGFMLNAEYVGNRAPLIQRSFKNIFYPVEYNQDVENFLVDVGRSRIFFSLPEGCKNLNIIDDRMISDERYFAIFSYDDPNGNHILVNDHTSKINWKPWEYDFPLPDEKIADSYEDF